MSTLNEAFVARREKLLEGGGEARIQKQYEKGKLTARERLALLFDEGSFIEFRAERSMPMRRTQRLLVVHWAKCTASRSCD